MGYATVEDYEARYGTLGESEAERVQVLLDDAGLKVDSLVSRHDIDVKAKADILTVMTCEYVHYHVQYATGSNIASVTHQAGSYLETFSMKTEMGFDKWATRNYGDMLGISSGNACGVKIAIHDRTGAMPGDLNDW